MSTAGEVLDAQIGAYRRILRIFGPPGTGKTTTLAERVKADVARLGSDSTLVASFTNTAAEEIRSRGTGLNKAMVGTLHSHAFKVCGAPTIALDPKVLADWNATVSPILRITATNRGSAAMASADRASAGARAASAEQASTGDELIAALDLLRARGVHHSEWPLNVRRFAKRWGDWKKAVGTSGEPAYDFSDLIVQAYHRSRDGEGPPGDPKRLVVDEAQDCTPIEIALALEWGRYCDTTVFGFDDDQAINAWRGGDPARLLEFVDGPAADEAWVGTEVLAQSYRVPAAVHAVAQTWILRSSSRFDKQYHPRAFDPDRGDADEVDGHGYAYRAGFDLADAQLLAQLEADLDAGETPMVLASCGYMLDPLLRGLRERGLPFANRFRPSDGSWNPLGTGNGVSTAERVYRFLVADRAAMGDEFRTWTGEDMRAWAELISGPKAGMVYGVKKMIASLPNGEVPWPLVAGLWKPGEPLPDGTPQASTDLARAVAPDLEWFAQALVPSKAKAAAFPIQVARARGPRALAPDGPRITVGTIHCSPPDEPVLTSGGYVPIGELDPARHSLVSYGTTLGLTRGTRRPHPFVRAVNPYSGPLLTFTTEASRTRVTPDHRMRVAWAPEFFEKWAVYLMRRGDWWRIGHCVTGHRPYRSGGVAGRMATEQADGGWVLGVYSSKREALIAEATMQARFGIPGTTFEAAASRTVSSADLHAMHAAVAAEVAPRAKDVLTAFGLSEDAPLYSRSNQKINRGGGAAFLTEARNVAMLSGLIELPTMPEGRGRFPVLRRATVTSEHYEGDVHSLEVLPHHHYVSGGAVVHNSVKGATASKVYVSPDLSAAAMRQWMGPDPLLRDQTIRLFYVALTRAFRTLVLLSPSSATSVDPSLLLPSGLEARR